MSAVMKRDTGLPAPAAETANVLAVIGRAAADPNVDIDKMERLLAMQERIMNRQSEAEFSTALAELQSELPSIGERGNAAGRYTYALWEDINTAIKPILQRYGFALSFRTDFANGIGVTAVLSHRSGHREQTSIVLPADKSGNKNDVQAVASSVSYGKRYTASALLNLTSHGEDDDAYRAGSAPKMTDDHQATITALCEEIKPTMLRTVLKSYKAESLADLPDSEYATIVKRLNASKKA